MNGDKPKRRRVRLTLASEPGKEVFVAGAFNDWDPTRTRMKDKAGDGTYVATMFLFPGRYEYKFVVNGVWCVDPECPDWAPNAFGSLNSVLELK
jgi:1,4-alpha-glucan branching enzyme